MTASLKLPVQISCNRKVNSGIIWIMIFSIAFATLFWFMGQVKGDTSFIQYLLLCMMVGLGIFASFLSTYPKPVDIIISHDLLIIKPISILGLTKTFEIERKLSEFDHISVKEMLTPGRYAPGLTYRILFSGKPGHADILCDPPNEVTKVDFFSRPDKALIKNYTEQLGEILRIKVQENA